MAIEWIQMRSDLDERPAVSTVAGILKIHPCHVVGCFWKLWSWSAFQTANGYINLASYTSIDVLVGVSGFSSAAAQVGWLKEENGGVRIPEFKKYLSKSAKSRLRQRRCRVAKRRDKERDMSRDGHAGVTQCHNIRGDKKRGDKKRVEERESAPATKIPPEPVWVSSYMRELGLADGESQKFVDYHESKGWVVGRVKMRNWKAACRTWAQRCEKNPIDAPPVFEFQDPTPEENQKFMEGLEANNGKP